MIGVKYASLPNGLNRIQESPTINIDDMSRAPILRHTRVNSINQVYLTYRQRTQQSTYVRYMAYNDPPPLPGEIIRQRIVS